MNKTYSLPTELMQAIVVCLNKQPAGETRQMLNAIEHFCAEQDKAEKATAEPEPA